MRGRSACSPSIAAWVCATSLHPWRTARRRMDRPARGSAPCDVSRPRSTCIRPPPAPSCMRKSASRAGRIAVAPCSSRSVPCGSPIQARRGVATTGRSCRWATTAVSCSSSTVSATGPWPPRQPKRPRASSVHVRRAESKPRSRCCTTGSAGHAAPPPGSPTSMRGAGRSASPASETSRASCAASARARAWCRVTGRSGIRHCASRSSGIPGPRERS